MQTLELGSWHASQLPQIRVAAPVSALVAGAPMPLGNPVSAVTLVMLTSARDRAAGQRGAA